MSETTEVNYEFFDERRLIYGFQAEILCDPGEDLFAIAASNVTVVAGNHSRLHKISQRGECSQELLQKMVSMALGRQEVVANSLLEARKKHMKKKNKL